MCKGLLYSNEEKIRQLCIELVYLDHATVHCKHIRLHWAGSNGKGRSENYVDVLRLRSTHGRCLVTDSPCLEDSKWIGLVTAGVAIYRKHTDIFKIRTDRFWLRGTTWPDCGQVRFHLYQVFPHLIYRSTASTSRFWNIPHRTDSINLIKVTISVKSLQLCEVNGKQLNVSVTE
jgi:hypothetical protein